MRAALVTLLGVIAVIAALSFVNITYHSVNATLPPVSKDFNQSLAPLAGGYFQLSEYNVTYYFMKFMPGWPEVYTVGQFRARDPGWEAQLEAVTRVGSGTYIISLGGNIQITEQQNSGPPTPTTAPLIWQTAATQRYSVLARAKFTQGGITAIQLVNFTATPMQKLAGWTFYCPQSTHTDTFDYCTTGTVTFGWEGAYAPPGVPYSTWTRGTSSVALDSNVRRSGTYSLRLTVDGTRNIQYGVAALIWDVSNLGVTTDLDIQVYNRLDYGDNSIDEITYIQFEIETTSGTVYLYYIRLISDWGSETRATEVWDVFNQQVVCTQLSPAGCTPPVGHLVRVLGTASRDSFSAFFPAGFNLKRDVGIDGVVKRMAFVAVDGKYNDGAAKSWFDDLTMSWRRCQLPDFITRYTRGRPNTGVFIQYDTPLNSPALVTRVDAYSNTGNVYNDYGYAIAVYRLPTTIPAAGSTISVSSRYEREASDVQNNAFFVSIGVDLNGDGVVDREYIYYRRDVAAGQTFVIVSSFIQPGAVVCVGQCTNSTQYQFRDLGTATSGNNYQWSIPLGDSPGAVVGVAFGVVDASGYVADYRDDFWVFWDNFSVAYSACDVPAGWQKVGNVWVSYGYLLVSGGAVYIPAGAITYVSNFTGVGRYVAVDSGWNDIFGVYWGGGTAGCIYGVAQPGARYVELRPLSGLGDIIIRSQDGAILQRHGCQTNTPTTYIAYKTQPGEILKIYQLEAWG